jgi:hypothetical protein
VELHVCCVVEVLEVPHLLALETRSDQLLFVNAAIATVALACPLISGLIDFARMSGHRPQ